jgi:predicted restriction endonuclease
LQRYGPRCPLSGIAVLEMLDAAHLIPDSEDGSSDPRNGLPLNAALHRAFDAGLFAIHPDTLSVETRLGGPALEELGIIEGSLQSLERKPHRDALQWRYNRWRVGG